jgi:hypothetical protein
MNRLNSSRVIRINTPVGLFVLRKKDVSHNQDAKATWTALQRSLVEELSFSNFILVKEIVACVHGEQYDAAFVHSPLFPWEPSERMRLSKILNWQNDEFLINCLDGTLSYSKYFLVRHFQLFDDYIADNPGVMMMDLPFTQDETVDAIGPPLGIVEAKLTNIYETLSYFNPKSNLHYFQFDLVDFPVSKLLELASRFTEEEKTILINYAYRSQNLNPLPDLTGNYVLGSLTKVRDNLELMKAIYLEKYPSFLFCATYEKHTDTLSLFEWDFSLDKDGSVYDDDEVKERIIAVIYPTTLEELSSEWGLPVPSILPYGVTID